MIPAPRRARTRVTRRIDADPTSTALLLAGPTAVDLWPGARRTGEDGGRVLVEVPADGSDVRLAVRALPPLRTPTAYVTRFAWEGDGVPPVSARLTLAYLPTGHGTPATHAVLELDLDDARDDAAYDGRVMAEGAEGFLANLARAAELRNRAA